MENTFDSQWANHSILIVFKKIEMLYDMLS